VETVFVLLPLALLIATIAVGLFIWAARTGQFDDLDTPAVRILFDDETPRRPIQASASAACAEAPGAVPTASQLAKTSVGTTRRVPE